jgi:hypothetical protein
MKTWLLFFCLLASGNIQAQIAELGVSGGLAVHTGASGSIYYKAEKANATPVGGALLLVNVNRLSEARIKWQVGAIANYFSTIKNEASTTQFYFGDTIGNDGRFFRYAKSMLSAGALVNAKYPLSDISYAYAGVTAGIAASRNTSHRSAAGFATGDITYTAPDGGRGYYAGLHAGITYRATQRLALNAEAGLRYYNLHFSVEDKTYPGGTEFNYSTMMIPVTIGIRYRIGFPRQINYETGRMELIRDIEEKRKDKQH